MPYAADFVGMCLNQAGEQYVFGAEVDPDDDDPTGPWDCSELTQWATHRLGVPLPDGSAEQLRFCKKRRTDISVSEAKATQGALLFIQNQAFHHVAVSLGNDSTIEARGADYGVAVFEGGGRRWTHAARVPGLDYGTPPWPPPPVRVPWPGRYLTQPPMMRGEDVRTWQEQMVKLGWASRVRGFRADGVYGPLSQTVCRTFQGERRLKVDGIVGPDTWRAAFAAP